MSKYENYSLLNLINCNKNDKDVNVINYSKCNLYDANFNDNIFMEIIMKILRSNDDITLNFESNYLSFKSANKLKDFLCGCHVFSLEIQYFYKKALDILKYNLKLLNLNNNTLKEECKNSIIQILEKYPNIKINIEQNYVCDIDFGKFNHCIKI